MTLAVAAAEGVGEDGRWGEEAEPMTPAVAAAEAVGEDGRGGGADDPGGGGGRGVPGASRFLAGKS
jgi:hypothetical protein